jgi:8-oxo-dGTP pyrophosphatase MutT (NUDIX family)
MTALMRPPATYLTDAVAFAAVARARLYGEPRSGCEAIRSPSDYDLNPDAAPAVLETLTPAAVLVPVLARTPLTVLLTERTGHLKAHAGQIAFPGGRIETTDSSPLAAALREAHEEVGLPSEAVTPLGYLDPYRTGTGYTITPVVALVQPDFAVKPDTNEVADVFEVPFSFLMDVSNHRIDNRFWRGADRRFYALQFEQRYIWGATAGIITTLYRRLYAT